MEQPTCNNRPPEARVELAPADVLSVPLLLVDPTKGLAALRPRSSSVVESVGTAFWDAPLYSLGIWLWRRDRDGLWRTMRAV